MKTLYELKLPPIPGLSTRDRKPDGWGEHVISKYRKMMLMSVYKSVNKDITETARIMGWSEDKLKKYLETASIEAPGASKPSLPIC